MTRFLPFKGYIPSGDKISDVAVRSNDMLTEQEILEEMYNNPLAYLHLTKSNLLHPERSIEDANYFNEAVAYVKRLIENGTIAGDTSDSYYLYRQTSYSGTFIGIIGLCDIVDYQEDRIKKHENTRVQREKWVARLVSETKIVGEPVLLAHSDHPDIQDAIGRTVLADPDVKFAAKDDSVHELWRLTGETADYIREIYEHISAVYIMDGHHRTASFARLYQETGQERYRYFLGMMLTSFNIRIWPFHRLVKLTDRTVDDFFSQLKTVFTVTESQDNWPVIPDHKGTFGVYMNGKWYTMTDHESHDMLDVELLEKRVLGPVLGIRDSRSDDRLEYLPGNHTIDWLQSHTDSDESNVLITLYPCRFGDIQRISDAGEIMPPKSTYIEPKGRPGMIIQVL